jgi:AraC family transcriptional regulator, regulatory protein of adaptative response / methylated-DNA-[protein]-cysteine methyltransferase
VIKKDAGRVPSDEDWTRLLGRVQSDGFYGVITTGIVCRAGCPGRTPLRRNVRMFGSVEAAVMSGFRACKRCQPMVATTKS